MKNKNNPRRFMMALIVAVFAAAAWSCNKDDDPSLRDLREDKLAYLEDSLRISDSLRRINAAGVVNYAITVVSGSTSTLFKNDVIVTRTEATKSAVTDAIVTISQFGKVLKDTTDASGMVVFNGFFRTAVNITIEKEGFTKVSYISVLNTNDSTTNSGIYFVGNLIPVFELTGANTATISGRANVQTNLLNKTREPVPDGTTITASIDAEDPYFSNTFLTTDLAYSGTGPSGNELIYVGNILDAAYSTNVVGSVTAGNYSITVPAAVNGLPIQLDYSELAADQSLFEFEAAGVVLPGDRIATYRTIFEPGVPVLSLSDIPDGNDIDVTFGGAGTGAAAYAIVANGEISEIVVTAGGSGYAPGTTTVNITTNLTGTGATATANVNASGVITTVTVNNRGAGYLSGNYPADPEAFTATKGSGFNTRPGIKYINDVYYGTGVRQPN